MFYLCFFLGLFLLLLSIFIQADDRGRIPVPFSKVSLLISLILMIGSFYTVQGDLFLCQIIASGPENSWMVLDCNGGRVMRHWILDKSYVENNHGNWVFVDAAGHLCYVSGDALVMLIHDKSKFLQTYKKIYNIPPDQEALH